MSVAWPDRVGVPGPSGLREGAHLRQAAASKHDVAVVGVDMGGLGAPSNTSRSKWCGGSLRRWVKHWGRVSSSSGPTYPTTAIVSASSKASRRPSSHPESTTQSSSVNAISSPRALRHAAVPCARKPGLPLDQVPNRVVGAHPLGLVDPWGSCRLPEPHREACSARARLETCAQLPRPIVGADHNRDARRRPVRHPDQSRSARLGERPRRARVCSAALPARAESPRPEPRPAASRQRPPIPRPRPPRCGSRREAHAGGRSPPSLVAAARPARSEPPARSQSDCASRPP